MGQFGIRRTTVDELVKRVNIPKGTFYLFYKSKELLLFDAIREQHELVNQKRYQAISEVADQSFSAEKLTDTIQKMFALLPVKIEADVKVISAAFHAIYYATLQFLDEPTSGLDPTNSRLMKDMILTEKSRGKTILLTTHNMQDATELCDRVAFIVGGRIFALDSPHNLIMSRGAANVIYTWNDNGERIANCLLEKMSED